MIINYDNSGFRYIITTEDLGFRSIIIFTEDTGANFISKP